MKKLFAAVSLTMGCVCAAYSDLPQIPARISRAEWLWSATEDKTVTTAICARCRFTVSGEVKSAKFRTIIENAPNEAYLNGNKIGLARLPELEKFRSHERGRGADITKRLVQGENVLAYRIFSKPTVRTVGFIMLGEIEYGDGRRQILASAHEDFKIADQPEDGWANPGFDDSKWPQARPLGDVRLAPWSNYGNIPAIYCTSEEFDEFWKLSNAGFPESRILAEPENPDVQVVRNGNVTGIKINGEVIAPFVRSMVLSSSPGRDAGEAEFAAAGMKFIVIGLGDKFRAGLDGFDFTELDAQIRRILAINPNAYFIVGYWTDLSEIVPWMKANPDEMVEYANPDPRYGTQINLYFAQPQAPSFASKAYRRYTCGLVEAFGAYIKTKPWGRRIAAMRIGYGPSNDGMPWGCHRMPDCGKRMTEAFRCFLKEKYGTDDVLQREWGDPSVTLATAKVPGKEDRTGTGGYIRDYSDVRDRRTRDYYLCYHREFTDFIREFGRTVHRALPGRLAGAYHGYTFLGYTPEGTTACFADMLATGDIDFLWSTNPDYALLSNRHYALHSPFHRFTKLASMEGDIRPHNNPKAEDCWKCLTLDETCSAVTKEFTTSILNGCGFYLASFPDKDQRSCFAIPEVIDITRNGLRVWHDCFRRPPKSRADIAIVADPDIFWKQGSPHFGKSYAFIYSFMNDTFFATDFTGYASDTIDVREFLETDHDYKAVVFLNLWGIDEKTVAAVKAKATRPGCTAIWCYAPGLSTESGFSDAAMENLTGMKLASIREERAFDVVFADSRKYRSPRINEKYRITPRVHCVDAAAEKLASFADDGTVAFARKRLANGSSAVFVGFPLGRVDRWADLFAAASCHAYVPQGYHVRATDRYLQVIGCRNGKLPPQGIALKGQIGTSPDIPVKLPFAAAKVTDAFTGTTVSAGSDAFTLHAENPHTWFLRME